MTRHRRMVISGLGLVIMLHFLGHVQSETETEPKKKLPKDPAFMTELDLENLYDQWEEKDEPLPDDELPPHKRLLKAAQASDVPLSELKTQEDIYKFAKKGKTLMTFVSVANDPTRQETEELTARWQLGLSNAHIRCQRFIVDDDRAMFVFEDGSLAFDAKRFFLDQPEVKDFTIDNEVFQGKGHPVEYPNAEKSTTTDDSEKNVKSERVDL